MPSRARDLTGKVFGRLTVLRRYDRPSYPQKWYCRCDCGTEIVTAGRYLLDGGVRSCGCLQREVAAQTCREQRRTHGHQVGRKRTPVYSAWNNMVTRCRNPKDKAYRLYGAVGIQVCDRWRVFANFLEDMGEPPPGKALTRIDKMADFVPGNCIWVQRRPNGRRPKTMLPAKPTGEHTVTEPTAVEANAPTVAPPG